MKTFWVGCFFYVRGAIRTKVSILFGLINDSNWAKFSRTKKYGPTIPLMAKALKGWTDFTSTLLKIWQGSQDSQTENLDHLNLFEWAHFI